MFCDKSPARHSKNAVRNFTGLSVGMGIIKWWLSVHFWVDMSFNEIETVNVWSLRSRWVCRCTNIRRGRKTKTAVLSCPCHLAFKWHSSQPITPPHWQHNTKPTTARVLFLFSFFFFLFSSKPGLMAALGMWPVTQWAFFRSTKETKSRTSVRSLWKRNGSLKNSRNPGDKHPSPIVLPRKCH